MYCPECEKEFETGKFCSECGEKLNAHPPDAGPVVSTEQSISEVGIIKDSEINQIGVQHIHQSGAPEELIACSRCGGKVKLHETFTCRECRGEFCLIRCYDDEHNICKVCARAIEEREREKNKIQQDVEECFKEYWRIKDDNPYLRKVVRKRKPVWDKASEKGCLESLWLLGKCCSLGIGVERDLHKAYTLFLDGADQGYVFAQVDLAYCYYKGWGVVANHAEAFKWFEKAQVHGDAHCQYALGKFLCGETAFQDWDKGSHLIRCAAECGHTEAQVSLGYELTLVRDPYSLVEVEQGMELLRKAKEKGHPAAQKLISEAEASWDYKLGLN